MSYFEGEEEKNPASTGDISPSEDIFLVIAPDRVRLRVDSHCLRSASRVFDAMFGPYWKEGQGLSDAFPKGVTLEEDDAESMRTTCCVIHQRNDSPQLAPGSQELLQIAILVNKYTLNVAMKHAAFF